MQDYSGEHKQFEFPSDQATQIWNATGNTISLGGNQYSVANPGNGNRVLTKLSPEQSMASMAQSQLDFQRQAAQPLVGALWSQIPTTQALYAQKGSALQSQMDPLKQRYESALGALTAGSATDVHNAQISAAREFGARGVPLSSSAYDQYLQNQTLPITSSYAGNYGQLQGQEAQDVLGLQNQIAENPILGQQAVGGIQTQIGQALMGNPSEATSSALQMMQLQETARQNAAQNALTGSNQSIMAPYYARYNTSPYYDAGAALKLAQAGKITGNLSSTTGGGGGYSVDYNGNIVAPGQSNLPPLSSFYIG